jgi:hypothetical protein
MLALESHEIKYFAFIFSFIYFAALTQLKDLMKFNHFPILFALVGITAVKLTHSLASAFSPSLTSSGQHLL